MNIILLASQALLCILLLITVVAATIRPRRLEPLSSYLPQAGLTRLVIILIYSVTAVACAVGTFVPIFVFFASCLAFASSILLFCLLFRSRITWILLLPSLMAIVSVIVALAQPLGLKVLALPKADDLRFDPILSNIIKKYDEGFWLEGIAASDDGTLYLAGNRGLEFSKSEYYREAQGELLVRNSDGSEHLIFKTPRGSTAGVIAVASDKVIYMTSHGDLSTIWRIDAKGKGQQIGKFPHGSWPNGLDFGPDGMLYTPDSHLGVIWRVNPTNGQTDVALKDSKLLARPFIALAPGANGLHFKGRDLIVTVSDKAYVLKYSMDSTGHFGSAKVIATGIPGDDFCIGHDGSLFITTHPYNTLVRVTQMGERTIIGKLEQHIVGATDAVFGKTVQDQDTLYVVTDGGAFTGGPKTRGELVALKPYANN